MKPGHPAQTPVNIFLFTACAAVVLLHLGLPRLSLTVSAIGLVAALVAAHLQHRRSS